MPASHPLPHTSHPITKGNDMANRSDLSEAPDNPEFFRLLQAKGIIGERDIRKLLEKFQGNALSALIHLVQVGNLDKNDLCRLWGDSVGFAYVDLEKTLFDPDILQNIPEEFARDHNVIPIYKLGNSITVAASDPSNTFIMKELGKLTGCTVSPVFSFPRDIEDAVEVQYQTVRALTDAGSKITLDPLFRGTGRITQEQLQEFAGNQATVEFMRGLLLLGVKERASDIHIEPSEEIIRVRFRIDGILYERMKLDKAILLPLISRLKVSAGADTSEIRKPQNGRINLPLPNKTIHLRFSTVPTIHGEKAVLHILEGENAREIPALPDLYFSKQIYQTLTRLITYPGGIFVISGPAKSGKTTTFYSILNHINRPGMNIMTVEDPVECRLNNINQVQTEPGSGFDFAAAAEAFLRQDAEVIGVGELRDVRTAKKIIQAALRGLTVVTTVHANDSFQALARLNQIGIAPFSPCPAVVGVMGQKLVRRLCDKCKEKYSLSPEETDALFTHDGKTPVFFYREKGCSYCNQTGFMGKIAIHEMFVISNAVRNAVQNAASADMRKLAEKSFQTLRYDGVKKVLRGLTTLNEINRVTIDE